MGHSLEEGAGAVSLPHLVLSSFGGAVEFIFTPQDSNVTGGNQVGGFDKSLELVVKHLALRLSRWPARRFICIRRWRQSSAVLWWP